MSKDRWDVYAWVGHGDINVRLANVSLKEAKKAKEKWQAKSPKHEAFIALHNDKAQLKSLVKANEKPKDKSKAKSKSKGKDKKSKGKNKK